MIGMIIEENIGKIALFQGEQAEIVGYAGNRYKLSNGAFAACHEVEFIEDPLSVDGQDGNVKSEGNQDVDASVIAAIAAVPKSRYSRKTGKPGIKAVSEALGRDISKDELDRAWEQYQNL